MIMANEKKLTKAQKYAMLLDEPVVQANPVYKELIEHEMELLANKNANKSSEPTKAQKANEELAQIIYEAMVEGKPYKCADIIKAVPACADMTTQKISPIMRNHENVLWTKGTDKRATVYTKLVVEDED
jgi:hypothetical protein